MSINHEVFYSLSNLYLAYRKAKAEAFHEKTHFYALDFTKYEQALHANLSLLRSRLIAKKADWFTDNSFIGGYAYLPKSVDCSAWDADNDGHFRVLDPRSDWKRRFTEKQAPAKASLRLIIRPTVDFQIVSALWILHVGHLFDAVLDTRSSFGNRLRRTSAAPRDERSAGPGLNIGTASLFSPYFSAYREWREGGLRAMETALADSKSILAITMDIEKFYHRVSPRFLLRPKFLEAVALELSPKEKRFTKMLLTAIDTWYKKTPDFASRPDGAIPVGLSASKIIANVLLVEFDRAVVSNAEPIYYGRYVDDIFLVLKAKDGDFGAEAVTKRLLGALSPMVKASPNVSTTASLTLKLPYAKDSELIFAGAKQKIFALSSDHGADLVHHIRDQIREQSSEYRLLPSVPTTGIAMASRALLATPHASLQVDALRKADVVSVRRLGFSLLLSDIEVYAADLRPKSWINVREQFYGLVSRHLITPAGFFEFFSFIPRVFGLMLTCGDTNQAKKLIKEILDVANLLLETTTLGLPIERSKFVLCLDHYAVALLEAGLQAATARSIDLGSGYLSALRRIKILSPSLRVSKSVETLQVLVRQVLLADWGRRPYKDYWFLDQRVDELGPAVPRDAAVRRQLRLGGIRRFRKSVSDLKAPHWPALAFPTRPLRVDEIPLVAPKVLTDSDLYRNAIRMLRGAGVASRMTLGFLDGGGDEEPRQFSAPGKPRQVIRIAVTSVETTPEQFDAAVLNKHDRSLERYMAFNGLINRILRESKKPDYIVMPELSVPLRWALRAARKLAVNGVSLLAGVEYSRDRSNKKLRNDCLVSLTTHWPGYASNVVVLQPKFEPAHAERDSLKKLLKRDGMFYRPTGASAKLTVYGHRGFFFSAPLCSDLTNIQHRNQLRGHIDALFALEWNRDINTFSSLVESMANDLHAFVIQTNNRRYGDSRIRAPAKQDYERDFVQVKGGVSDYFVLGEVDYYKLRSEQRRQVKNHTSNPCPSGMRCLHSAERQRPNRVHH